MENLLGGQPFLIDYTRHPGFEHLVTNVRDSNLEAMALFKNIDSHFSELLNQSQSFSDKQIDEKFNSGINQEIARLQSLVLDSMSDSDRFKNSAIKALQYTLENLHEEALFRNFKKHGGVRFKTDKIAKIVQNLATEGYSIENFEASKLGEFWNEIKFWRENLMVKRQSKPAEMASCVVPLPQEGRKWALMREMVENAGILEAINSYSRHPMDLDYYALQLSHEHESWWKGCYDDVSLPTSNAAYLHNDQDYSLVKAIVYLQPVDLHNSPFCVVPKSHLLHPSYSRNVFFKGLDHFAPQLYSEDQDAKGPYYRKEFKLQKYRGEFLKLPKAMMGTSHFGDDLLNEDQMTKRLLEKELKITSEMGNCIVFTGGRTFHRGGMVERGERWVVQLGFRKRDLSWAGLRTRTRRLIKAALPQSILDVIRKKPLAST